ncbi:MAG: FliM/FliN family flagellar motor switch protein [Vicinamibacterales bacterium]
MRMHLTTEAVTAALIDAMAQAWGSRAGSVTATPGETGGDEGWLATWTLAGSVQGAVSLWFERASTIDAARTVLQLAEPPADADVQDWLRGLLADALTAFLAAPPFAGVTAGEVTLAPGAAPEGAARHDLAAADMPAWHVAAGAAVTTATAGSSHAADDDRLSAVLDVELPLVVRFGRAVMPFRALAGLGPGSVVDMGRSPEEPVELLVGERLIARGEVVVVGGNYGVRITELTGARASSLDERSA